MIHKKISVLLSTMALTTMVYAQQTPTGTPGNSSDWRRGGNLAAPPGLGGTNNIFGTMWNSPIYTQTFGVNRMKLNGTFGGATGAPQYGIDGYGPGTGVNTSGYFLLGGDGPLFPNAPANQFLYNRMGAFSLLHLNGGNNQVVQQFGYRPWMRTRRDAMNRVPTWINLNHFFVSCNIKQSFHRWFS